MVMVVGRDPETTCEGGGVGKAQKRTSQTHLMLLLGRSHGESHIISIVND